MIFAIYSSHFDINPLNIRLQVINNYSNIYTVFTTSKNIILISKHAGTASMKVDKLVDTNKLITRTLESKGDQYNDN